MKNNRLQEKPDAFSAADYFNALEKLSKEPPSESVYMALYALMGQLCEDMSDGKTFSNLFSRLSYVAHRAGISAGDELRLQTLRRKCHHLEEEQLTPESVGCDIRLMTDFVAAVLHRHPPLSLLSALPLKPEGTQHTRIGNRYLCIGVTVKKWDEQYITTETEYGQDEIKINYAKGGFDGDLTYLKELLYEGLALNLLKVHVGEDGTLIPQTVVVMPDYLIDVSALSQCFKEYGHDARNFILNRLNKVVDNPYTVLGNLVGDFLDDLVTARREGKDLSYRDAVVRAFRRHPLMFAFVDLNSRFSFHDEAKAQFLNLKNLVNNALEKQYGFDLKKGLLEPTFVCPALGISGRMDYLQSDYSKVIEQKSGKRGGIMQNRHREPHFVQMMLYRAILEYNNLSAQDDTESFLLYSRYADGLMQEQTLVTLLREAVKLRNEIVTQELFCARKGPASILKDLTPEKLAPDANGHFWENYLRPGLEEMLRPFSTKNFGLSDADKARQELCLAYFYRQYAFVQREQLMSRLSTPSNAGRGQNDLWNLPAPLRRSLGGLYMNLKVAELRPEDDDAGGAVETVVLNMPDSDDGFQSNFREGDAVILYSYDTSLPDVRRQSLMRGRLAAQNAQSLTVKLNHPQSNAAVFGKGEKHFAIEHDYIESGFNNLFSGLYKFLCGDAERQDLILGRRAPRIGPTPELTNDYGDLNELIKKERAAEEIFFVIGPPGSGKTSCALRGMVLEEICSRPDTRLLLTAYTNRAVDELCGMLEKIQTDHPALPAGYLRIGSEFNTAPEYRKHLLTSRAKSLKSVEEIRSLVKQSRILVGTTATLSGQDALLRHLHFDVAFVDEASQLLEPQLLSLLFSRTETDGKLIPTIRKWVLVGDQKQLPAVVVQPARASAVKEPALLAIGLTDCRHSLFERLLGLQQRNGRTALYHLLNKQGRMHPDIFGFVNGKFYNQKLTAVGLPHQRNTLHDIYPHADTDCKDRLGHILATHRQVFLNITPQEEQIGTAIENPAEAQLTARCIASIARLQAAEGRTLHTQDVGIIVPYRIQIAALRRAIEAQGFNTENLCIDTVERFQGSQRDFIFYDLTVKQVFQLGFLTATTYLEQSDNAKPYLVDRKMIVALTRARKQLVIIGNARLLSKAPLYRDLIESFRQSGDYFDMDSDIRHTD